MYVCMYMYGCGFVFCMYVCMYVRMCLMYVCLIYFVVLVFHCLGSNFVYRASLLSHMSTVVRAVVDPRVTVTDLCEALDKDPPPYLAHTHIYIYI